MAKTISVEKAVAQLTSAIRADIISRMIGADSGGGKKTGTAKTKKSGSKKRISLSEDAVVTWAGDKEITAGDIEKEYGCSYITATKFLKASKKFGGKKSGNKVLYKVK